MSAEGSGLVPGDHPDRIRWNAKYGTGFAPSFRPHPLAVRALALGLPDGPVADLACGPSGAALMAAEQGRRVTAVDVSEVALGLLGAEAGRAGAGRWLLAPGRVRRRGRRGSGRRPARLGGVHRRRPRSAARVVPGAGRARVPLATRIQRPGPERDTRPRPPSSPGPSGPAIQGMTWEPARLPRRQSAVPDPAGGQAGGPKGTSCIAFQLLWHVWPLS